MFINKFYKNKIKKIITIKFIVNIFILYYISIMSIISIVSNYSFCIRYDCFYILNFTKFMLLFLIILSFFSVLLIIKNYNIFNKKTIISYFIVDTYVFILSFLVLLVKHFLNYYFFMLSFPLSIMFVDVPLNEFYRIKFISSEWLLIINMFFWFYSFVFLPVSVLIFYKTFSFKEK